MLTNIKLWLIKISHWLGLTNCKDEKISGLTKEKLMHYAETHRPPQSWYDEDFEGFF